MVFCVGRNPLISCSHANVRVPGTTSNSISVIQPTVQTTQKRAKSLENKKIYKLIHQYRFLFELTHWDLKSAISKEQQMQTYRFTTTYQVIFDIYSHFLCQIKTFTHPVVHREIIVEPIFCYRMTRSISISVSLSNALDTIDSLSNQIKVFINL